MEEFFGLSSDIQKNSETGYILFYQSREWTCANQGGKLLTTLVEYFHILYHIYLWLEGLWLMQLKRRMCLKKGGWIKSCFAGLVEWNVFHCVTEWYSYVTQTFSVRHTSCYVTQVCQVSAGCLLDDDLVMWLLFICMTHDLSHDPWHHHEILEWMCHLNDKQSGDVQKHYYRWKCILYNVDETFSPDTVKKNRCLTQ